jgi:hypothetical protein
MSERDSDGNEFERRIRAALEQSVERLDARTRSRLNQVRHRALAEYAARRASPWRRWIGAGSLLPAGAVAAAALVAITIWNAPRGLEPDAAVAGGEAAPAFEDLELLADAGALVDGSESVDLDFYEWAAAEAEALGT